MRWLLAALISMSACGAVHVSPYATEVYRVGRFDDVDPAGPRFIWSASRFSLRFEGPSIVARLHQTTRPSSVEGPPQFLRIRAELDGKAKELYADGRGSIRFEAKGLASGPHTLTLVRQSEALIGEGQLIGFELAFGSRVLAWGAPPALRLEFIGDSITVGFGDEGTDPCHFSSQTQAITTAFPWLVGQALGADLTVVGWSGHGVVRNWGDRREPTVPQVWTAAPEAPDAVFIALGANDFWNGDPGPVPFAPAYAAFAERVQAAYPKATLYAVITPTGSPAHKAAMRTYLASARARLVELSEVPDSDGRGCVGHPSALTQQRMADELVARLRADRSL